MQGPGAPGDGLLQGGRAPGVRRVPLDLHRPPGGDVVPVDGGRLHLLGGAEIEYQALRVRGSSRAPGRVGVQLEGPLRRAEARRRRLPAVPRLEGRGGGAVRKAHPHPVAQAGVGRRGRHPRGLPGPRGGRGVAPLEGGRPGVPRPVDLDRGEGGIVPGVGPREDRRARAVRHPGHRRPDEARRRRGGRDRRPRPDPVLVEKPVTHAVLLFIPSPCHPKRQAARGPRLPSLCHPKRQAARGPRLPYLCHPKRQAARGPRLPYPSPQKSPIFGDPEKNQGEGLTGTQGILPRTRTGQCKRGG